MIILKLATPFNPGMYDEGQTYSHVLVTHFHMAVLENIIEIRWEYGTMSADTGWQSGKAGLPQLTVVQNEDFYKAIAAMPANGAKDSILMAAARECYEILTTSGAAPGEVISIDPAQQVAPEPTDSASGADAAKQDAAPSTASASS